MKDKLTKRKRVKIDYKNLIKEEGLWSVYKKYRKRIKDTMSERKIQYRFCRIWLNDRLNQIKDFELWCVQEADFLQSVRNIPWDDED